MIEIKEITKRYEDSTLGLDHVSFSVQPGEVFCLLGANGAGKTTLINILLDFLKPTGGKAIINEHNCNRDPLKAKRSLSFIPENAPFYSIFTARQNVAFFTKLAGRKRLKKQDYDDAMRSAGIPEKALTMRVSRFPRHLRQKLAIAITLLKDPPTIIMDEPTGGLDPNSANDFLDQVHKLREQNKAILMTTQDIFHAKMIADRIGIIKQGRLVAVRERDDFRHADLEEIFVQGISPS